MEAMAGRNQEIFIMPVVGSHVLKMIMYSSSVWDIDTFNGTMFFLFQWVGFILSLFNEPAHNKWCLDSTKNSRDVFLYATYSNVWKVAICRRKSCIQLSIWAKRLISDSLSYLWRSMKVESVFWNLWRTCTSSRMQYFYVFRVRSVIHALFFHVTS